MVIKERQKIAKCNQAIIRMIASPVNPSDCGQIAGRYPANSDGNLGGEGVGVVLETSSPKLAVGDLVIPRVPGVFGVWREEFVVGEKQVISLEKFKLLPVEVVSSILVNPLTALLLLKRSASLSSSSSSSSLSSSSLLSSSLQKGDNIIINAPSTQVGRYVEDLCGLFGYKLWSSVAGGNGLSKPPPGVKCSLALDCVGGKESTTLMSYLGVGGTHVVFGGMGSISGIGPLSTGRLIFSNIIVKGFWLPALLDNEDDLCVKKLIEELCDLFLKEHLRQPKFKRIAFRALELPRAIENYSSTQWRGGGKPLIIF